MTSSKPLLPLLIEAPLLAPLLDDPRLLIIDLSSEANYQHQHIPGAVHLSPAALKTGTPPAPGKLPSAEQLSAVFSQIGLTPERHVVAYDDEGGGWAGRLIWTLDVLGHQHSSYLNGGIHAWAAAGLPLSSEAVKLTASDYQAQIHQQPIAEIEDILAGIATPDQAIWDARSAAEYRGEKVLAARGGHIPGAINIDWLELIDDDNHKRLINLQQLQQRLEQLGLSRDKTIITHCQTHHRSGLTYLAMKILGYPNIKAYPGSWSEWGNHQELPITTD